MVRGAWCGAGAWGVVRAARAHPRVDAVAEVVLGVVALALDPLFAAVEGDFDPAHLAAAARVGVAAHGVAGEAVADAEELLVAGRGDDRVHVQVVEQRLGLVPPPARVHVRIVHARRHHPIVCKNEYILTIYYILYYILHIIFR